MNITERVERGIALLDEKGPEGWRERVNLDKLIVASRARCVLAQVYESYGEGRAALGVTGCGHEFGFCDHGDAGRTDAEWRRQLAT